MTLFSLKEYISYNWKSQTRHGVHSPFVYDLIDKVLLNENRDNGDEAMDKIPGWITEKHKALIAPIISLYIKDKNNFPETPAFAFINAEEQNRTLQDLNLKSSSILFVTNIHSDKLSVLNWARLCNDSSTNFSVDLYEIGILFFRKEFKEKQHFVLKYTPL